MAGLIVSLFSWFMAGAIGRMLLGAGLAVGTYAVLSALIDDFLSLLTSNLNNMASDFAAILWIAGVGEAISIVGSALVAVTAVNAARVFVGKAS